MSNVPNKLIRILAVDDHALLRKGLAAVINAEPDLKLVAEASNGEDAVEKFRAHHPDLVLMDLQMPGLNGIEATNRILSDFPDARIIVLTTYHCDVQVVRALPSWRAGLPPERARSGTCRSDSCRLCGTKDNPAGDCRRAR
jgi:DNA-binding NarL/FixJ family response regulator